MQLVVETGITCPYCYEEFPVMIDTSQGDLDLIEDCTVCCRPIHLLITCEPGEVQTVEIEPG